MATADLTAARLREALSYDPLTGVFTRLQADTMPRGGVRYPVGSVAGRKARGYIRIGIDGRRYFAHVLAVLYMTGEWPRFSVDHIDGVRDNNAWGNLRDVPHSVNIENRRSANSNNSTGVLGVCRSQTVSERWIALIHVNGKKRHLGSFATKEDAHAAYVEAKRLFHDGCTL